MKKKLTICFTLATALAGCGHKSSASLDSARQKYKDASQDSWIAKESEVPLYEAKQSLDKAEKAKDKEDVNHYAYLTERKVDIARNQAEQKKYESDLMKMGEGRQQAVLNARTREAEMARKQAEEAEQRAKTAETASQQTQTQLQETSARTAALEKELAGLKAKETEAGTQITLRDMMFESGKADLTPGGQRDLERLVSVVKQSPERNIVIEGHTDSIGAESFNQTLSERRAQAVERILTQSGIPSEKITTKGYGKTYPVAPNTTREGRQRNRRVEVTILNEGRQASDIDHEKKRM